MKYYLIKSENIPDECDYLTKGKVYQAFPTNILGVYFITCDDGEAANIRIPDVCAHLNNKASWEVLED